MTRKNIILDLDNTLLSAEALTEFPFKKNGMKEKALQFAIHDMDGYYIVFERKRVQEFLDYLFQNFNVSIWTAASQSYCLYIVEHMILIKPERQLNYIFFSYHCGISKKLYKGDSKNLKLLWEKFNLGHCFQSDNTLIIDDHPEVYKSQRQHCIHIYPFNILDENSEHDEILMTHIKPLLERFKNDKTLQLKKNIGIENESDEESSENEEETGESNEESEESQSSEEIDDHED